MHPQSGTHHSHQSDWLTSGCLTSKCFHWPYKVSPCYCFLENIDPSPFRGFLRFCIVCFHITIDIIPIKEVCCLCNALNGLIKASYVIPLFNMFQLNHLSKFFIGQSCHLSLLLFHIMFTKDIIEICMCVN